MMLNTTRKKRPPLTQLKYAASIARKMLFAKRIISEKSIFEKIAEMDNPPMLPGIIPYLPHRWTLEYSRHMIMDITKKWVKFNNGDNDAQEKIEPFFRFAIRRIEEQERKWQGRSRRQDLENVDDTISAIFSNHNKMETARLIKTFLIDSFMVSSIVKLNDSVSDYLTWFIDDWTVKLNDLWKKKK